MDQREPYQEPNAETYKESVAVCYFRRDGAGTQEARESKSSPAEEERAAANDDFVPSAKLTTIVFTAAH